MTNKQMLKDSLGWGFILWIIGYVLGIILHWSSVKNFSSYTEV